MHADATGLFVGVMVKSAPAVQVGMSEVSSSADVVQTPPKISEPVASASARGSPEAVGQTPSKISELVASASSPGSPEALATQTHDAEVKYNSKITLGYCIRGDPPKKSGFGLWAVSARDNLRRPESQIQCLREALDNVSADVQNNFWIA